MAAVVDDDLGDQLGRFSARSLDFDFKDVARRTCMDQHIWIWSDVGIPAVMRDWKKVGGHVLRQLFLGNWRLLVCPLLQDLVDEEGGS